MVVNHVLRNDWLGDFVTEERQLRFDTRRTPGRVARDIRPDQIDGLGSECATALPRAESPSDGAATPDQ